MIRLAQPWSLLVFLLLPFVLFRLRTFPRASALRRGVAWGSLCLALAGPELVGRGRPEPLTVLVDLSASTSRSVGTAVERIVHLVGAAAPGPIGVVGFAARPYVVAPVDVRTPAEVAAILERLAREPGTVLRADEREETDLGAALLLAGSALGTADGGRVLLASDGWETRGEAQAAAEALARRGVALDVLAPSALPVGVVDASVEDLDAPGQVAEAVAFDLAATVRSTVPGRAVVSLRVDDRVVERRELALAAGATPIRFTAPAHRRGEVRYGIHVSVAGDEEPRNDEAATTVNVVGRPRVLWVTRDRAPAGTGLEVLESDPAALGSQLSRIGGFDAVVADDVELAALPAGTAALLRDYVVRRGGGFLMLGARGSFGPGGYRGTAVEEILPVELDPGSRRKQARLALVLALDKSGSMADGEGMPKLAAARAAALDMVSVLAGGDRFGLVAFDTEPRPLLPLASPPGRDRLASVLDAVVARGGTRVLPALATAETMLRAASGERRHVVLVTDGRAEGGELVARARALGMAGVTVSVVAVGDDADLDVLRAVAAAGRGRFVLAADRERLGTALRREVVMARGPVLHDGRTAVLRSPHAVLDDLDRQPLPPLGGYVSTAAKPVAAVVLRTDGDEPLLALGTAGLGRAAALMTDVRGPWTAEWRTWNGLPRLLGATLRWLARPPVAARMTLGETPRGDGWMLTVYAEDADGNRLDGAVLAARLAGAAGTDVPLRQRGPGAYWGPLPGRVTVPTAVVVEDRAAGRVVGRGFLGLGYPEEYRVREPNTPLLERLARITDGRWLERERPPLAWRLVAASTVRLTPGLLLAALAVFLGACRRNVRAPTVHQASPIRG